MYPKHQPDFRLTAKQDDYKLFNGPIPLTTTGETQKTGIWCKSSFISVIQLKR